MIWTTSAHQPRLVFKSNAPHKKGSTYYYTIAIMIKQIVRFFTICLLLKLKVDGTNAIISLMVALVIMYEHQNGIITGGNWQQLWKYLILHDWLLVVGCTVACIAALFKSTDEL